MHGAGSESGLQMEPRTLKNIKVLGSYTLPSSVLLVLFLLLLAFLLTLWTPMMLTTAFLSAAPGGVAEMGVAASMVHADLSMVSGYQLFRVFFIMFVISPLLQRWLQRSAQNQ